MTWKQLLWAPKKQSIKHWIATYHGRWIWVMVLKCLRTTAPVNSIDSTELSMEHLSISGNSQAPIITDLWIPIEQDDGGKEKIKCVWHKADESEPSLIPSYMWDNFCCLVLNPLRFSNGLSRARPNSFTTLKNLCLTFPLVFQKYLGSSAICL